MHALCRYTPEVRVCLNIHSDPKSYPLKDKAYTIQVHAVHDPYTKPTKLKHVPKKVCTKLMKPLQGTPRDPLNPKP